MITKVRLARDPTEPRFSVLLSIEGETEATHAEVRVFYRWKHRLVGVGEVVRSQSHTTPVLTGGVLCSTADFSIDPETIEFITVELLKSLGRERHDRWA